MERRRIPPSNPSHPKILEKQALNELREKLEALSWMPVVDDHLDVNGDDCFTTRINLASRDAISRISLSKTSTASSSIPPWTRGFDRLTRFLRDEQARPLRPLTNPLSVEACPKKAVVLRARVFPGRNDRCLR